MVIASRVFILFLRCVIVQSRVYVTHSDPIWRGRYMSSLVQVMACRMFGAKALPEQNLTNCHFDTLEQT